MSARVLRFIAVLTSKFNNHLSWNCIQQVKKMIVRFF